MTLLSQKGHFCKFYMIQGLLCNLDGPYNTLVGVCPAINIFCFGYWCNFVCKRYLNIEPGGLYTKTLDLYS